VELPGGGTTTVDFADGTEAGSYLPLYRPPADLDTGLAAPFAVRLRLVRVLPAELQAVPADQIGDHVTVRLVEGVTGRLLYLIGAEKQRLRRQARTVALARSLDGATGDALDRIGAELGVARFLDRIRFDEAPPEEGPSVFGRFAFGERPFGPGRPDTITSDSGREPDGEYRRRLAIYRPWLYPTRRHITAMLNGPGAPTDPNGGLLGALGVQQRAVVTEAAAPLAAAVHLVAVGDPASRTGFSEYIRRTTLIWPGADEQSEAAHAQRFLPRLLADRVAALRRRLRTGYEPPAATALAPMLALALDRVARCRRALGVTTPWPLLRSQDLDGGSRYELGLGADLRPLSAAELDVLAERLRDGQIDLPEAATALEPDPAETAAVLSAAVPRPATEDSDGAWLLEACGLRTVHPVRDDVLYVSHIPTFGLTIAGPPTAGAGDRVPLEARYHAAGEPGSHVLIVRGLAAAVRNWTELGHEPWRVLGDAAAHDAWAAAVVTPGPAAGLLGLVGLPTVSDPADLATRLLRLPPELIATLELPAAEAERIIAGRPEALADLRELLSVLTAQAFSAALPVVLPGRVVIVVGGIALPLAGVNLAERAATRFRWYATRIWPADGTPPDGSKIGYLGARTEFTPAGDGLYAIVSLGQIRSDLDGPEPYEFAVDLPEGTTLSLTQYEYLMNFLAHVHPAGTRVNTSAIRRTHVDLDGDGTATPVPSTISRTFRQFRRDRFRGQTAAGA
jgi:hypothetical protein